MYLEELTQEELKRIKGYIQKEYHFEESIEIERSHTGRYGAGGLPRRKRRKATPEDIARQNQTNRENTMRRILKANFKATKDYWVTYTYKKGTRTNVEAVNDDLSKLIKKIKYQYKKRGAPCKWVARVEVGKHGAGHIHMVINRIPDADLIITDCWSQLPDSGHADMTMLRKQGEFKELAAYIVKKPPEEEIAPVQQSSTYRRSRNLIVPKPKRRLIKSKRLLEDPKPYKGYFIDKSSINYGVNPVTGHMYQHFTMIKGGPPDG